MLTIKAASLLALFTTTSLVSAHGHVASWTINGETKAGFNPSNPSGLGATAERPTDNSDQGFTDWTSGIVACGGKSAGSGLQTWDVDAGSTVVAHWNTWPDSHKGPVTEYMARCPSSGCDGVAADSLKWFKIQEDGFDGSKWATDTIVSTLAWSFKIPSDLAPGAYLVRHDLLAMHTVGAPQVYPVCFQANLKGSGSAVPTDTTTFPAAYNLNDAFKTFDIYANKNSQFVAPGPAVYAGGAGGGAVPTTRATTASTTKSTVPVVVSSSKSTAVVKPTITTKVPAPVPTTVASSIKLSPTYPIVTKSSTAASVPVVTAPTTGGNLGGPAPAVMQSGTRWTTSKGGDYQDQQSAKDASCMFQMNACKDWANTQNNAKVSAAMTSCDVQATTCKASSAGKRAVMARYAKRA